MSQIDLIKNILAPQERQDKEIHISYIPSSNEKKKYRECIYNLRGAIMAAKFEIAYTRAKPIDDVEEHYKSILYAQIDELENLIDNL